MFSKNQLVYFLVAVISLATGFALMVVDPADDGAGLFTLWIAPPLLLAGFLLPLAGIGDILFSSALSGGFRKHPTLHGFGAIAFLSAFVTYILTLEPTASLWDCSEFIASSYKLQVPHTPGTPLALLIGRLFTMMSFGDTSKVAWCLNLMSGFFSALTVWVVYHIIALFAGKILPHEVMGRNWLIYLSAVCGSMCLAFSDSFWFSAVEAETYGIACFFLMVLVWLILTGKELGEPFRSRRLVLIFYLAGLAYCVHPMCLLALAILPFAWFVNRRTLTTLNVLTSIAAGLAIVLIINRFVAVGLFELAFSFDVFFVNDLRLPFYSGAIALCLILIIAFRILIRRYKRQHAYLWAALFLVLGFLPYLTLFIRSNRNPPIDETNPENLPLIKAYMNRESYPSRPLLYGPYFDARIESVSVKKQMYFEGEQSYEVAGTLPEYHYNNRQTLLPRMYSNDASHIQTYREWTGLKADERPTFVDNLQFMFTYQLGHMYMRYLMFNFAGRTSDEQGSPWLKPWENASPSPFEQSDNQYWMIPLCIGLLGAVFQYKVNAKEFISNAMFFLLTGLVLALYLNSTPNEPRERDYIYVGSYIAFSIWIGLGVLALEVFVSRWRWAVVIVSLLALAMPAWMGYQNADDHDRSGRTFQIDHARLLLNSCAPNAILFTGGDNDTFPLWYLQEVEGFRTDVRVMVLSYMNTDWYVNQLRRSYYNSPAFKLSLTEDDYRQYGPNDVLYVQEAIESAIDVRQYLALLKEEHPGLRMVATNGEPYHIMPSRTLGISTPASPGDSSLDIYRSGNGSSDLLLTVSGDYVSKNMLAILDLIVSNGWSRPVYFNFSSLNSLDIDLSSYVIQEGPLFRLSRHRNSGEAIRIDPSLSYRNLIAQADYSNVFDPSIFFSYEDHFARMIVPLRQLFNDLAVAFLRQGDSIKAREVVQHAIDKLYPTHLPPSYTNLQAAEILLAMGDERQAKKLNKALFEYQQSRVDMQRDRGIGPLPVDEFLLRRSRELLSEIE